MLATGTRRGDFCESFAVPLPARMMCLMLGAPEADHRHYTKWSNLVQFLIFHDPEPGSYEPILKRGLPPFPGANRAAPDQAARGGEHRARQGRAR